MEVCKSVLPGMDTQGEMSTRRRKACMAQGLGLQLRPAADAIPGYFTMGRLFANGYLKALLKGTEK